MYYAQHAHNKETNMNNTIEYIPTMELVWIEGSDNCTDPVSKTIGNEWTDSKVYQLHQKWINPDNPEEFVYRKFKIL